VWAGLAGVAFATVLFTGLYGAQEAPADSEQPEKLEAEQQASIFTIATGSVVLVVLGIIANIASRRRALCANGCDRGWGPVSTSALLWLLAVAMEVGTAYWALGRRMPFAVQGSLVIFSMQAIPLLVAGCVFVVLQCRHSPVRHTPGSPTEEDERATEAEVSALLEKVGASAVALRAVRQVQRAFRAHLRRVRSERQRNLDLWASMRCERNSLTVLVYFTVLTLLGGIGYVLLLFGSRFTADQGFAWVRSFAIAVFLDVAVQQPILAFCLVSAQFIVVASKTGAKRLVVNTLVAQARASQLLYEEAMIRDRAGPVNMDRVQAATTGMSVKQLLTFDGKVSRA
ncbi:unnamed protein product, partial [Symbiodinium sp. KB8]